MRTFILFLVLCIASPAHAELKSYMLMKSETLADAIEEAELGFAYYKSNGVRILQIDSSGSRSNRRRNKEFFLSTMNGFYLTPDNELLEIRDGKLKNRLQIIVRKRQP